MVVAAQEEGDPAAGHVQVARQRAQRVVAVPKDGRSNEGDLVDDDAAHVLNAHAALARELGAGRGNLGGFELLDVAGALAQDAEAHQRKECWAAEWSRGNARVRRHD